MANYKNNSVLKGTVRDQEIIKQKNGGTLFVKLVVVPTVELKNGRRPKLGGTEIPEDRREGEDILVSFAPEKAVEGYRTLQSLGFDHPDILRLNPDHPHHFSLEGREVYVRVSYSPDKKVEGQMKKWVNLYTPSEDDSQISKTYAEQQEALLEAFHSSKSTEEVPY